MKMKVYYKASKEIEIPDKLGKKWLTITNIIETSDDIQENDWEKYSDAVDEFYDYIVENINIKKDVFNFEGDGIISADFILKNNKIVNFMES